MAGPWMSLSTSLNVDLTLGQTLRKKGCMPKPKYGVAFGSINDGFTLVGPFEDDDVAIGDDPLDEFVETCGQFGDDYHIFQIYSPNDFKKNYIGDWVFKEEENA